MVPVTGSQPAPMRAVIFTDVNGPVSAALVAGTLAFARLTRAIEVVGLVVSDRDAFRLTGSRRALRAGRRIAAAVLDDAVPLSSIAQSTLDLDRVERRSRIPVLVPEGGDPNDPRFVRRLTLGLRPSIALSFYCLRVFRGPLLAAFEQSVNYHDSLLPRHRGLLATSFSIYAGDSTTGYTFHRMDESLDSGPILTQGEIPVSRNEHIASVKQRKLGAAVMALPQALARVVDGDPGHRQPCGGEYHSRREAAALVHVERPEEIASAQLIHRLRAFGTIWLRVGGASVPVTRLRSSVEGRPLAFAAADGTWLEPDRVNGLPVSTYRFFRRLEELPVRGPAARAPTARDASVD